MVESWTQGATVGIPEDVSSNWERHNTQSRAGGLDGRTACLEAEPIMRGWWLSMMAAGAVLLALGVAGCATTKDTVAPAPAPSAPPLHNACRAGDLPAAKAAMDKGASVNGRDASGFTPLHCAALWGRVEIVELLIARGAEVNAEDERGVTPLVACIIGFDDAIWGTHDAIGGTTAPTAAKIRAAGAARTKKIIELLVLNGADVNCLSGRHFSPLSIALIQGDAELADMLRVHGGAEPFNPERSE